MSDYPWGAALTNLWVTALVVVATFAVTLLVAGVVYSETVAIGGLRQELRAAAPVARALTREPDRALTQSRTQHQLRHRRKV